jgi:hypothetical protein
LQEKKRLLRSTKSLEIIKKIKIKHSQGAWCWCAGGGTGGV